MLMLSTWFSSRAQAFSLLFLVLAGLPSFHLLPPLLLLALVAVSILHKWICTKPAILWGCFITIVGLMAGLVGTTPTEWLSAGAIITALFTVLFLKWLESKSEREYRITVLSALILVALSSLYLPSLPAIAYLMLMSILALVCLLMINDVERRFSLFKLTKLGGSVSLLVLPITIVLFVTVPRVQGPLWDLGIAIGLPIELAIDQDARDIGLTGSLKAGQVSRLKKIDSPILVAEFTSTVPYKSKLYWRGPVFSDYDGVSWELPNNWDKRSNLLKGAYRGKDAVEKTLQFKKDRVHYEARVSPHAGHWLYALDVPVGQTPEAVISKDLQLLGIRSISWEFKYDISAWLEYSGGRKPSEEALAAYLNYPDTSNPRLREFGQSLNTQYENPQRIIEEYYRYLAATGYRLTLTTDIPENNQSLDHFFFDTKEGTIEHLASSTAMVLRAAGIPTRLISGYRGGNLIALTDFVVVKQEHAHVWVEAWTDKTGWMRVEAKDIVLPPEKNQSVSESATKKAKQVQPEKSSSAAKTASEIEREQPDITKKTTPKDKPKTQVYTWSWLNKLSSGVETWVLNYNPDRQVELLKKSGLRKVDWKNLLAICIVALFLLTCIYAFILIINKPKKDPVAKSFESLNRCFAKKGLGCKADECPSNWLVRIEQENPELYPSLKIVLKQYMSIRYGCKNDPKGQANFIRDVKRLIAMVS